MFKRVVILLGTSLVSLAMLVSCSTSSTDAETNPAGLTFQVFDGTKQYQKIMIKGSMTPGPWNTVAMNDADNDHIWTVDLMDIEPGTYEWGAIEDDGSEWGLWLIDGPNKNFTVNEDGTVTGELVYMIPMATPPVNALLKVDMSAETVSSKGVHVAGDFGSANPVWTPSEILLYDDGTNGDETAGDNVYSISLEVASDKDYQFKFINGDDWGAAESVPEEYGVDDNNGGFNRQVSVGAADATFGFVFSGAPM